MNWIKVVIIIIRDKNGNFFVHQRNKNKKTFPNLFGIGAGGHIEENESKEVAAKRELFEETGLKTELKYLFQITYKSNEFTNDMEIFETETNFEKLETDNGEWQWCGWMTKEKIDELLNKNQLCPDTAEFYKKYITI